MPRRNALPRMARMKNGRTYQKNGTRAGITYLRCQKSTVCRGTAKIVNGEIIELYPHSEHCFEDNAEDAKARFKEALKEALQSHWYRLKDLYDTVAQVYPDAPQLVPYVSIRSFMKRCRQTLFPPRPEDVREFVQQINNPQYARNLEYATGRMSVELITDGTAANHAVLYDEDFVTTEMRDITRLFIDGTFKSTPDLRDAYQLVTIIGIKLNYGIPFFWIIMSRKTQQAYHAVFTYLRENVIPQAQILLVMSDFETALRNAIRSVFEQAQCTGCNVHFDRALYQKAKSQGLQNLLQQDDLAKTFFKKTLVLAYLPANVIEDQFRRQKNQLPAHLKRRFGRFLSYFDNYWLKIVKPPNFSVWALSRRTNNISESYNSKLGHKLETRPSPWDFICKLLKLQSSAKTDVQRLRNNCRIQHHARYATVHKQKELTRAWRDLHMHAISIDEFMEKAAALKGDVSQRIALESNGREGRDFELTEPSTAVPLENDPDYDEQLFVDNPAEWLFRDNAPEALAPANDETDETDEEDPIDENQPADENIANEEPALPYFYQQRLDPTPEHEGALQNLPDDSDNVLLLPVIENEMDAVHSHEAGAVANSAAQGSGNRPPLSDGIVIARRAGRQRRRQKRSHPPTLVPGSVPGELEGPAVRPKRKRRNRRRSDLRKKAENERAALLAEANRALNEAALAREEAETARATVQLNEELAVARREAAKCTVCLLAATTHTFLPCGHRCCCATCANRLWDVLEPNQRRCPLCRTVAEVAPQRIWITGE